MLRLLVMVSILGLGGCVSTQFKALAPGTVKVGDMSVEVADASWNKAPTTQT